MDKSARRDQLIQAAMAVFAAKGYEGATVEDISRACDVAKGTLYLYFSDKADLFFAVFQAWSDQALAASKMALADAGTASESLVSLAMSAVEFIEEHKEWFPLTLEVWAASCSPALRERFAVALGELYAGYRRETEAIISAGQAAGEFRDDLNVEALSSMLTGAVDGLFIQCWLDPALNPKKLVSGFLDVVLRGAKKQVKAEDR